MPPPGELPKELGKLVNLTVLGFNGNDFRGELPKELGKLVNLSYFNMAGNSLSVMQEEKMALTVLLPGCEIYF